MALLEFIGWLLVTSIVSEHIMALLVCETPMVYVGALLAVFTMHALSIDLEESYTITWIIGMLYVVCATFNGIPKLCGSILQGMRLAKIDDLSAFVATTRFGKSRYLMTASKYLNYGIILMAASYHRTRVSVWAMTFTDKLDGVLCVILRGGSARHYIALAALLVTFNFNVVILWLSMVGITSYVADRCDNGDLIFDCIRFQPMLICVYWFTGSFQFTLMIFTLKHFFDTVADRVVIYLLNRYVKDPEEITLSEDASGPAPISSWDEYDEDAVATSPVSL